MPRFSATIRSRETVFGSGNASGVQSLAGLSYQVNS